MDTKDVLKKKYDKILLFGFESMLECLLNLEQINDKDLKFSPTINSVDISVVKLISDKFVELMKEIEVHLSNIEQ